MRSNILYILFSITIALFANFRLSSQVGCEGCYEISLEASKCNGNAPLTTYQSDTLCVASIALQCDCLPCDCVECPVQFPKMITDGAGNFLALANNYTDLENWYESVYVGWSITYNIDSCKFVGVCIDLPCAIAPDIPVANVFLPPTTVINPPVNGILPAPTDDDMGCPIGFISQEVTINGGGLNFTLTSFPADLVTLLCGQTNDGSITNIISNVVTDCGIDTDTLELNLLVQGGVITGVDNVSCSQPPTTTINPLIGTILPAPTNDDGGCAGGFISEVLTINWAGGSVVLPNNSAPYNLCDYLVGQPYSFEYFPSINSSVTTDCGNDVAQLSIPVTESGGFITGVNGVLCLEPPTTDITGITGTIININDTHGVDAGSVCTSWTTQAIDFTTANGTYGSFNVVDGDDLCTILSYYDTGNTLDHKNIPVVITRNVEDCGGVASDTLNTYIEFNNGVIIAINGINCPCLEITPSMVVGGNNVCVAPYGERENVVITDASAPIANINGVMVNYEVRDQDGNVIVSPTTVIPPGSAPGSSSSPLPDILGTHRYVITEEVEDINGCVVTYYGYNTVSLRINCLVPTPRSTDVNTAPFVECGASGGLFSSLASMDGDTSYDLLMLEGFSGVSASQLVSQNITVTNQTTGESMSYTLTGEWQNIFYETEAQILADFPSGLNSGNTIEIIGTVTFANGCTTAVQTGTNTLP